MGMNQSDYEENVNHRCPVLFCLTSGIAGVYHHAQPTNFFVCVV
jgi:hypothetical protein